MLNSGRYIKCWYDRSDPLYVRKIIKRALVIGSTSIVTSHSHPIGDAQSFNSGITLTRQLAEAFQSADIELIDHIIMTFNNHLF